MQFKYPKGERIISDFLGIPPQEIWPSRYPKQV
nr:MAG TPA: winged helix-turn-helix DNA-binding protein [Caudoviricetes sp.]